MEAFTIVAVWLFSLVGGALITIGLITFVTGRRVINVQRINWSRREAKLLGLCSVVQGAAVAAYALYGGLAVGLHVIPYQGAGSPWAMFVSAPLWLVVFGAIGVQVVIEHRHKHAPPSGMR